MRTVCILAAESKIINLHIIWLEVITAVTVKIYAGVWRRVACTIVSETSVASFLVVQESNLLYLQAWRRLFVFFEKMITMPRRNWYSKLICYQYSRLFLTHLRRDLFRPVHFLWNCGIKHINPFFFAFLCTVVCMWKFVSEKTMHMREYMCLREWINWSRGGNCLMITVLSLHKSHYWCNLLRGRQAGEWYVSQLDAAIMTYKIWSKSHNRWWSL